MKVRTLAEGALFDIVGVMDGDSCPSYEFLHRGEANMRAARDGLLLLLDRVADDGWENLSTALVKQVDKREKIYEFRKGDLRLFFFKGNGRQVAVCSTGVIKKTQKVDHLAVSRAAAWRGKYLAALKNGLLEVI